METETQRHKPSLSNMCVFPADFLHPVAHNFNHVSSTCLKDTFSLWISMALSCLNEAARTVATTAASFQYLGIQCLWLLSHCLLWITTTYKLYLWAITLNTVTQVVDIVLLVILKTFHISEPCDFRCIFVLFSTIIFIYFFEISYMYKMYFENNYYHLCLQFFQTHFLPNLKLSLILLLLLLILLFLF